MNYSYSPDLVPVPPARPLSQLRERSIGSARGNYGHGITREGNTSVRNPGLIDVQKSHDLSHIRINDLLNYKRGEKLNVSEMADNIMPNTTRNNYDHKSNSAKNNNAFMDKAFQMDELLKLRDHWAKLEQENRTLKAEIGLRDNKIGSLSQNLSVMESEIQLKSRQHSEELIKKSKLISKLKNQLKDKENQDKNVELDLSSGWKNENSKFRVSDMNSPSVAKLTQSDKKAHNLDMPLSKSPLNIKKSQFSKNSKKQWKGDLLLLDDLEKIYKKLPEMDRLEVWVDFTKEFKSILRL